MFLAHGILILLSILVSSLQTHDIDPNDEWINVSKDLAENITNILLLLLHIIKVKSKHASLFGQNIAISYFTGCFLYSILVPR
ncbi:hypothetical protein NC651_027133 [Populus alba x Populus x berolinensis]|nr:hypothetical protein NC651_027133 [Populus alba x Populus x berolinensis]